MKDLILSFINPLKMKRFRFMSVFISILIFIVSVYLIALPNQVYIDNHKTEFLSQKSYVNAYLELPELALGSDFISSQYVVDENYEMVSKNSDNKPQIYKYSDIDVKLYNEENSKTIDINIVFDINDTVTTRLNNIKKEYTELYPDDSNTKANYSSYIYFMASRDLEEGSETETWKQEQFLKLHETEESELQTQTSKITNFDLFGLESDENDYLLIFLKQSVITHIPLIDEEKEAISYPALSSYYKVSEMKFDFTECENLNDFGIHFADVMFEPLSNTDQTNYLIQVLGYVILFPGIYVLILCWSMKKRGVMKTFKEYYNIASIASVVPAIITFILAWFIPKVVILYGALFCVFVLFSFIKINSTPELGD